MRSGWLGGIAVGLVLVAACGAEGALTVNGQRVAVRPAVRFESGLTLVPVAAVAPLIGAEASERDGRWSIRWSEGCDVLAAWELWSFAGVSYTSLEGLIARVGGSIRRVGDETDVEVPQARLIEFGVRDGELVVRLDRFAPTRVTEEDGLRVVRFSGCTLGVAEATATFGPGGVASATLAEAAASCEVRITFLEEAALAVRRLESDGAYSVFLLPADAPSTTLTTVCDLGVTVLEGDVSVGGKVAQVDCVAIAAWRGRLDVRPILPPSGVGTQATIDEMVAASRPVVVLSAADGVGPGLVVVDGVPLSLGGSDSGALGFDAFGSLVAFVPEPLAFADLGVSRIPLDGVNRPVGYDELVGYPAGYTGSIARGFPERFRVARLRDGAVVSIVDATYVVADPSATLLVASGAAREHLAGLSIGDRVALICDVDPARRFISHALSVDGMLLWDGGALSATWDAATTWSVAGTDWQGGFFFLRASCDAGLSDAELIEVLACLPAPARDAVVLERNQASALALDLGGYHPRWGAAAPIELALGAFLQ